MLTSIFSSFDAYCVEFLGCKARVSLSPPNEEVVQHKLRQMGSTKFDGVKKAKQIDNLSFKIFCYFPTLFLTVGVQTSCQLSLRSTATMGMSLRDGSINLSNTWTR